MARSEALSFKLRWSSIRFSHIMLFTCYDFRSPSLFAFLRQQLCTYSSVGFNSPDHNRNSSHVILIHPYLRSSSISPLILNKTCLAEPFPEITICNHYIYSALLVAPEENHSIHMGTMSVCINYHPFYSLDQNGGLASDLMTQKCTVDDNSSSRCNRYSSAQISHDVL